MFRQPLSHLLPLLALLLLGLLGSPARLLAAPSNDNFAAAQVVSGLPGTTTGSNIGATHEVNEAYVGDGTTVWYQWTAAASGGVTFYTTSANFYNTLAIYSGGFTAGNRIAYNNTTTVASGVTFNAVAGTTYDIAVDGNDGQTGSFTLGWVAGPPNDNFANAQTITGLPGSTTGTTVNASHEANEATVGDGATVWYQWTAAASGGVTFYTTNANFYNTLAIYSGGFTAGNRIAYNNTTTVASGVTFHAVAGTTYDIAVDGNDGQRGTFTLNWIAGPANDDLVNAQTISGLPGMTTGTTVNASHEANEATVGDGATVWYQWTAAASGGVTFYTTNANFYNTLAIYSGGFTAGNRIAYNNTTTVASGVTFHAVAGTTYDIAVDGNDGQRGTFTLNWIAGPANDDFANAQVVSGLPGTTTGTTVNASHEANEATVGDGATVWYQWTASASGGVTFYTTNASAYNTLAIYSGGFTAGNRIAYNNTTTVASGVTFHAVAGTTYDIAVDGNDGQRGTFTLSWIAGPANDDLVNAQTITGLPGTTTGTTVNASHEANEATVGDGATVWYQWTASASGGVTFYTTNANFYNTLAIYSGGFTAGNRIAYNNTTTVASGVTFHAVAGTTYDIAVDGNDGQRGTFTLSWIAGPANDDILNAQVVTSPSTYVSGTTVNASHEVNENYVGDGATVWYQWTASASGGATFTTINANFYNTLAVYSGGFTSSNRIAFNNTTSVTSTITFNAVAGTTYDIAVDGNNGQRGTFTLYGGTAPANDEFVNAQVLPGATGEVTGINLPATTEPGEPNPDGVTGGASVWYQWTAPGSGSVTFDATKSNFNALLAVYTGPDVAHLTAVGSNVYGGVVNLRKTTLTATAGATYYITVAGVSGQTGQIVLDWAGPAAPVNTTTALTSSVNPSASGQSVTFTATVTAASGSNTPTGTVQFTIDGTAVGSPVTLTNGVATDSTSALSVGTHTVSAAYSGDTGFIVSTSATLTQTVTKANTTTTLTSSLNPSVFGQSVTFTATVAGNGPTGTVTFTDTTSSTTLGTGTLAGGITTFTTASLSIGSHQIVAVYAGDASNKAGSSAARTQTVNAIPTTTTLASSLNPSVSGQSVTFTATVTQTTGTVKPTGTVQFTIDGVAVGSPVTLTNGNRH